MKTIKFLSLVIVLLSTLSLLAAAKPAKDQKASVSEPLSKIEILSPEGRRVVYEVEVAKNNKERTIGLMYRKHLDENKGMFFIFQHLRIHSMWMKNTHIPLDIIFIDKKLKIVGIVKNTVPFDESTIAVKAESLYALEINAGQVDKYNITVGSLVVPHNIKLK